MRNISFITGLVAASLLAASILHAAPRKAHIVVLGAAKHVPYSKTGDPAGAATGETELKIRALLLDGALKEWTTGDAHDVTDHTFVIRQALKLNDILPGEKLGHWVWQRGPWLVVDRVTGHATELHLPAYDPAISRVSWFRDYAAYCGLTPAGKSLYAVITQLGVRKTILRKRIEAYNADTVPPDSSACTPPEWQRDPARVTFHLFGNEAFTFDLAPGAAPVEAPATEPEPGPGATPVKPKEREPQ
jgi:hypothetical protein